MTFLAFLAKNGISKSTLDSWDSSKYAHWYSRYEEFNDALQEKKNPPADKLKPIIGNPWIRNICGNRINYKPEFALYFRERYLKGELPSKIFADAGFPGSVIGYRRVKSYAKNVRKKFDIDPVFNHKKESFMKKEKGNE